MKKQFACVILGATLTMISSGCGVSSASSSSEVTSSSFDFSSQNPIDSSSSESEEPSSESSSSEEREAVELRWVIDSKCLTGDAMVSRDVSTEALNNNQYYLSIKESERNLDYYRGDSYVVANPYGGIMNAQMETVYSLFEDDEFIKNVNEGDTITLDGDYVIQVSLAYDSLYVSFDGGESSKIPYFSDYVIPERTATDEEGKVFIGYKLDQSERLYQPGETLRWAELKSHGRLEFTSAYLSSTDENTYHIATCEEWLAFYEEDIEDEDIIVYLDADLDFSNADFGPGLVDFNGTFFGGGHKITNARINPDDTNEGNGCGLIQYTSYGCNVYDLTMESVHSYCKSAYGQAAVIGEADGHINISNVHVKDFIVEQADFSTYGFSVNGISALVGSLGSASIVNCSVDGFSLEKDREFFGKASKNSPSCPITFGGMVGLSYYTDDYEKNSGLVLKDNSISDVTLSLTGVDTLIAGGLMGIYNEDGANGYAIIGNEISDVSLSISGWKDEDNLGRTISMGGMFGEYEETNVFRNRYSDEEEILSGNVISENVVENIALSTTDTNEYAESPKGIDYVAIGLFAGVHTVTIGSNQRNDRTGSSEFFNNRFEGSVTCVSSNKNATYVGGISGDYYQESKGRAMVFFENNEVVLNAKISDEYPNSSKLGGLFGYVGNGGRDALVVTHNLVKGTLEAPGETYSFLRSIDPKLCLGGIIGLLINDESYTEISENVVDCAISSTSGDFASGIFYYLNNAYGDSTRAELQVSDNMMTAKASAGAEAERLIALSATSLFAYRLSSYYWECADGAVALKGGSDQTA